MCLKASNCFWNNYNFLFSVITGDETWVYCYNLEAKRAVLTLEKARPLHIQSKASRSKLKSTLVIFFHSENTVHQEFAPPSQTVNQHYYYWKVLQHLRGQVHLKHPEWQQNQDWLIQLHYVLEHIAVWVQEISAATNITVVPCPSHSPDVAPWDFSYFQE